MTNRRSLRVTTSFALLLLIATFAGPHSTRAASHIRFRVGIDPALARQSLSGRLLILMTTQPVASETIEIDYMNPRNVWITGMEVKNLTGSTTIDVDPDALSFPTPFSTAPAGDYRIMALLDVDHSYTYSGTGPGDVYSSIASAPALDPMAAGTFDLKLTKQIPEVALRDTYMVKLIEFQSPSLSAFSGRPILMKAGVVLPSSYAQSKTTRYPTVYVVHGYGGSHASAWLKGIDLVKAMNERRSPEMIYVFLNAQCPLGHHVFADSVNNGPWGHALTTELIPYLEKTFRMDGVPRGRFLSGHSSGGWSTLWLQVTYPDFFGGTWSTSPDPVNFRAFTGPDLTRNPPQNFYRAANGVPYDLVRMNGREIMTLEEYTRLEVVEGDYGGQLASFDAVFSPRGDDGQPMQLFDRETGRIDPLVAKAWERYDIDRILRTNWARLGPKLRGKIHIAVGTADTFHLDEAVYLLRDTLKSLGSDARIEFIEGRTHFDLYEGGMAERFAKEMYAVARPGARSAKAR